MGYVIMIFVSFATAFAIGWLLAPSRTERDWVWDEDQPEPPEDVRVEIGDKVVAVDCRYKGRDAGGIAVWEIIDMPRGKVTGVKAKLIPPKTAISIPLWYEHEDWYR
jgi:hypothetical protein